MLSCSAVHKHWHACTILCQCIQCQHYYHTSAPVTIKDLVSELHDVIIWFQLGIYLDISPSELMKIRADHREKTDDCKTEMLVTWLRQTTDASWSTVVRALVGIRMGALAQKVAVKYGEIVPHTQNICMQC